MPVSTRLEIRRVTPAIGAEITGVDLSEPLDDETVAAIRAAWIEHLVVFFPEQPITPDQQLAFARRFGDVTEAHPVEPELEGHPQILPIDSAKDRTNFWHTDVTFMARPPTGSILQAIVLPETGGDTMWSNTQIAYDTLAEPLRHLCDHLSAWHWSEFYADEVKQGRGGMWEGERLTELRPSKHPVVRIHPESGRKGLFVNPNFTVLLDGFDKPQSDGLLNVLYQHMTEYPYTCRYHWRPGSIAFWDNRSTMHYGIDDYGEDRRVMHRVTLRGDRPYGPGQGPPANGDR